MQPHQHAVLRFTCQFQSALFANTASIAISGRQWNILNLHLVNDKVFIQVHSDTIESPITNKSRRAAV